MGEHRHSLARRHYLRTMAAQQRPMQDGGAPEESDAKRLMLAALWADRRTLKDIKSVERKIAMKRDLLPKYDDYIAGVLESDSGQPDEVLMTAMIWRFDIQDLSGGMDIADYAIRHDLETPDRFRRDTPTLVAEEVAEQVLAILDSRRETDKDGTEPQQLIELAQRAERLTHDHDIHDPVDAKLYKAAGFALRAAGRDEEALDSLSAALRLHPNVGVKKDIERLKRAVEKQQTAADQAAA